jgi:hypothetical protein
MAMLTAEEYRESLRRFRPRVFVDGEAVELVADEPRLAPGIAAIGVTYDFATRPRLLDRGVAGEALHSERTRLPEGTGLASIRCRVSRQPGRCCDAGCEAPPPPA